MSKKGLNERYSRQRDIMPADRLAECKATVIGVGAIGRHRLSGNLKAPFCSY